MFLPYSLTIKAFNGGDEQNISAFLGGGKKGLVLTSLNIVLTGVLLKTVLPHCPNSQLKGLASAVAFLTIMRPFKVGKKVSSSDDNEDSETSETRAWKNLAANGAGALLAWRLTAPSQSGLADSVLVLSTLANFFITRGL